jgi:hypothetical protein
VAVKVLRVEGMRDDTRTDDERRALEAAEAQPLDMTVDAVLDAARRESGFDDFGPRDFVERLGCCSRRGARTPTCGSSTRFRGSVRPGRCNRLLIQRYWLTPGAGGDDRSSDDVLPLGSTHLEPRGCRPLAAHLPCNVAAHRRRARGSDLTTRALGGPRAGS